MAEVAYFPRILTSGTNVFGDQDTFGSLDYNFHNTYDPIVAFGLLSKGGASVHGVTIFETTGSGITGSGTHPDAIPQGSIITDAFLRLTPPSTSNDLDLIVEVFLPGLDGRWNIPSTELFEGPDWINHAAVSFDMTVTVTGGTEVVDTMRGLTNLGGNAIAKLRTVSGSGPEGLGQLFSPTSAGTLDTMDLYLRKDGGLNTGNVWVEVYFPTSSGGSPSTLVTSTRDLPDLDAGIVATSDTVGIAGNVIANFVGSFVTFTFTGDDQIEFAEDDRYVAVLRGDYAYDLDAHIVWFYRGASINFFGTFISTGRYFLTGNASSGSGLRRTGGFNDHLYIVRVELPARTNDDGTATNINAFGSSLTFTIPQWTADVVVEIGSIADLIQQWVSDTFWESTLQYLGIPIMLSPPAPNVGGTGDRRYWARQNPDDSLQAELVVTYRAPEDRRVQVVD